MINHSEWDYLCSVLRKLGYKQEAMQIQKIRMMKKFYYQQEKERMKNEIIKELRSQFNVSVDTKNALQSIRELKDEISDFLK